MQYNHFAEESMSENVINQKIHDIRKPLNSISMQAELIKILVESNAESSDIITATEKIIANTKECSALLQTLSQ